MEETTLKIKKYPNRRFYDASRSKHVTLAEMHELVCAGQELEITDSASGETITNTVLTQILVERDPTKLNYLPPMVLHQIIRTREQLLGGVLQDFLRQMVQTQQSSQEQWSKFMQATFGVPPQAPTGPENWAKAMEMFNPFAPSRTPPPATQDTRDDELNDLRQQVADLARKLEQLTGE
jgi:polyhydroxyalkanoate synthesis repressor PhaR